MRDRGKRKSGVLASALRFGRSSLFFNAASSILTDGGSPENDVEPVADQRRKKERMLSQLVNERTIEVEGRKEKRDEKTHKATQIPNGVFKNSHTPIKALFLFCFLVRTSTTF